MPHSTSHFSYPPDPCSAGAHPAIADAAAWLPIHYACDNGHLKCVEVIVNFPNQLGLSGLRPALDVARGNNHEQIVKLLEEAMQRYTCMCHMYTCLQLICMSKYMQTSHNVHACVQAGNLIHAHYKHCTVHVGLL